MGGAQPNQYIGGAEPNQYVDGAEPNQHLGGAESNQYVGEAEPNQHVIGTEPIRGECEGESTQDSTLFPGLTDVFFSVNATAASGEQIT